LGWGLDPYPGHSPLESVINANLNASSINGEMFGWSAGSLLLAVIMLFSGALRRPDWELLVMVAITLGAYSLYWFSGGPDFGARYWYLVLIAGVALTARAVQWLDERTGMRALPAIACLGLMALVNYFPWRSVDKYHHYLRMRPDVRALAARHAFGRSLVLVRGERFPDYESAAIYNPLDFHAAAPVYAWDRNPKVRAEALRAFSDRPVWVLEGPTITKGGFRVVSGPTPATDLLKASP